MSTATLNRTTTTTRVWVTKTPKPLNELRVEAIKSYMRHNPDWKVDVSNMRFVNRITFNFIRHSLFRYDTRLAAATDPNSVRHEVLGIIARNYPELVPTIEEQRARKGWV